MRKGQEKILEKAKKKNCSSEQLEILSDESYSLDILQEIYAYFIYGEHRNIYSQEQLAEEVLRVFSLRPLGMSNKEWLFLLKRLLPFDDTQGLFGSVKKRHILKLYQWLPNSSRKMYIINQYQKGWGCNLPKWHLIQLVKLLINYEESNDDNDFYNLYSYISNLLENENMRDDFIYNKENSFLCIYTKNVRRLRIHTINDISLLYDINQHAYKVNNVWDYLMFKENENEYIIDKDLFTQHLRENGCPFECIRAICEENLYKLSDYVFEKLTLEEPDLKEKLYNAATIISPISVEKKAKGIQVKFSGNRFINVEITSYRGMSAYYYPERIDKKFSICYHNPKVETKFFITPDGKLFETNVKSNASYPMPMYRVCQLIKDSFLREIFEHVFADANNPFIKDALSDMKDKCLVPVSYNELLQYHNRAEFIKAKYKTAKEFHIKWNKLNLNLSYMIIASSAYVRNDKSKNILMQQKGLFLLNNVHGYLHKKLKVEEFLAAIIVEQVANNYKMEKYKHDITETGMLPDEIYENIEELAADYVSMSLEGKMKVRLDVYKITQLEKEHNAVSEFLYEKETSVVKVPKDSKFVDLRKILPEEFEWIKSRRRLIAETRMQHHCVWSYADYITKDECAIYSFVDYSGEYGDDGVPGRYTIEFRQGKRGEYYINQVQGRYNRARTLKIGTYIQKLLSDSIKQAS